MPESFSDTFQNLKKIMLKHQSGLNIRVESATSFSLYGKPGPATIKAWGGKLKKPIMPVAWIETGKGYVSYHIMGLYTNTRLLKTMTKELKARMQGKTCFNFKKTDDKLLDELDQLTGQAISDFKKEGYVV